MEGPGVHTTADTLSPLVGKKVISTEGKSRFPLERIIGEAVTRIYPIGKLLFLEIPPCTLRVHFLMWGRYRLNGEIKGKVPKISLSFDDGSVLRFYASAIALLASEEVEANYDRTLDPMDGGWDPDRAARLVKGEGRWNGYAIASWTRRSSRVSGTSSRTRPFSLPRCHPASPSGCIPGEVLRHLLLGVRDFSFTWYRCDQEGKRIDPILSIYRKKVCPECGGMVESGRIGRLERISYWCPACQVKYRC